MKTLYITDLDGTLLGPDSRVSEESAGIISELSRLGALITVATARTPATVVPLLQSTVTNVPAIVMTGAALWHRDLNRFDRVKLIPDADRQEIDDICQRLDIHPFVYTLEGRDFLRVYHGGKVLNRQEDSFVAERRNLPLKQFVLNRKAPDGREIVLYYATGERERLTQAAGMLRQRGDLSISCYPDIFNHNVSHLEIFASGVSKAAAVLELKKRMDAERVVVFGDNLNDIPMMKVADHAVAVGNAFDEVKEIADEVIGPNATDSVAKFIRKDFELSR